MLIALFLLLLPLLISCLSLLPHVACADKFLPVLSNSTYYYYEPIR